VFSADLEAKLRKVQPDPAIFKAFENATQSFIKGGVDPKAYYALMNRTFRKSDSMEFVLQLN